MNAAKNASTIAVVRGTGPRLVSANVPRKRTVSTSAMLSSPATFQCSFSNVTQNNVASRKSPATRE